MSNEKGKGKVIGVEDKLEKVEDLIKEIRDILQKQEKQAVCTVWQDMKNKVLTDNGTPSSLPEEASTPGDGDMQMVKNLIEECLVKYMSQKQVTDILYQKKNIHPSFTQTVWQHLEEQNEKFFIDYYERLALIREINWLNNRIDKYNSPRIFCRQFEELGLKLQRLAATTLNLQPPAPAPAIKKTVWQHLEERNLYFIDRVALIRQVNRIDKRIEKETMPDIARLQPRELGLKFQPPAATTLHLQPPAPANCRQVVWGAPN